MKLWRLTRAPHVALDGQGAALHGGRYSAPGRPVISFASEAGLAVLVAMRYVPADPAEMPKDYVLGWTQVDVVRLRIADEHGEASIRKQVDEWLGSETSLLAAIRSKVLPEADVILMNAAHPDAVHVPPLTTRPFSFADCLHKPPMLDRFGGN